MAVQSIKKLIKPNKKKISVVDSLYLGSDRKEVVNHLQIRPEDSRVQRKKLREKEKMQKQQSAKIQREKGRARLRRRIRRNVGEISRSEVEALTMAEPVSTRLTLC